MPVPRRSRLRKHQSTISHGHHVQAWCLHKRSRVHCNTIGQPPNKPMLQRTALLHTSHQADIACVKVIYDRVLPHLDSAVHGRRNQLLAARQSTQGSDCRHVSFYRCKAKAAAYAPHFYCVVHRSSGHPVAACQRTHCHHTLIVACPGPETSASVDIPQFETFVPRRRHCTAAAGQQHSAIT